ncbi:hypothetical protein [Thermocoleostomius sinensis]|jgi:Mg-chelatase subunit ChlI|uniref:Mobilization protein MobC n=1 Tax=Thermocoleostomius sinensis A174 TaxID=2016057 RepID=A0A9E9C3G7_9CYAN|nr:hypothetical protein [Thermocoleostomius sinensis]WAL58951.1 hypothetical protein OXH18_17465 [Thermocoleostomius sinensis A174]
MAGTSGRRSRAASIQKQAIDQVNTSLQELPAKPKDNLSLREAVNLLQDEIRSALAKGYSHEDLAAIFADQGIEISALTLKRYVSSGRNQGAKSKSMSGRTRTRRARKSEDTSSKAEPPTDLDDAEMVTEEESASGPGRRRKTSATKAQSSSSTKSTSRGTSTRGTTSTRTRRRGGR